MNSCIRHIVCDKRCDQGHNTKATAYKTVTSPMQDESWCSHMCNHIPYKEEYVDQ
jgi:hypothetical protein